MAINKDLKIMFLEDFDKDDEICDNISITTCEDDESESDYDDYDDYDENVLLDNVDIFENPDILKQLESDENESNEPEFYDISIDGEFIPEVDIQIDIDENKEKIVKFILKIPMGDNDENITVDLNINKQTYLMIAEELFKK